ncbi:hypothetical protein J2Z65_004605 [Paenibacillus aceris]|uniref:Uncharacterized protein n=1 Tax=Paenibacillus aceris TaxID=869555 RepID=A0ABS4I389_9BACL|nr:hypothetical protein [Paenibacillus aceris]
MLKTAVSYLQSDHKFVNLNHYFTGQASQVDDDANNKRS